MPCECGKTIIKDCSAYCNCDMCNMCHEGGFCPNGKTWWHQKGKAGIQQKRELNQSHGGHGWYPTPECKCTKCIFNACKRP